MAAQPRTLDPSSPQFVREEPICPDPGRPWRWWAELDRLTHATEGQFTWGLSPAAISLAALDWSMHLANVPFHRLHLAQYAMEGAQQFWHSFWTGVPARSPGPDDRRFRSPDWSLPPFRWAVQAFLLTEDWWAEATRNIPGVDPLHDRIVCFAARQWLDMLSPSNFPWLNPEVIERTAATGGGNFLAGARTFVRDFERLATGGEPEFGNHAVGKDLAVTPGKVVFRNELIELLQYEPTTKKVFAEPVLIVPAWIMKYYVLDLSRSNSMVKYLVDRGFTVFCVSWRNPGPELRHLSFEDYRVMGFEAALEAATAITASPRVHACGYCLGGTLLAVAAAERAEPRGSVFASLTFIAAQVDFTEAGELQLFINNSQVDFIEDLMEVQGYLDGRQMGGTFQLLRSNDLIWSRAVRAYLKGEQKMPTDLKAWVADVTRMPACMHSQYLRRLFLKNQLARGRFEAGGRDVSIADIKAPMFVVGVEKDHIAPWRSVYRFHVLNDDELTFVLASGGHNVGVVAAPGGPKAHFWIHARRAGEPHVGPDQWRETAEAVDGSWWPTWVKWMGERSSGQVEARSAGAPGRGYPPLADAPGVYVLDS
jgi:polyhydroxyalkanoate synthase